MEIKNLIEITPEIRKEAFGLIQACNRLKQLVNEQYGQGHFGISVATNNDSLTIYDRHEYSKDNKGKDLGFFVHWFYSNGEYKLGFIAEDNEEARAFDKAFNEAWEAENGEDE